MKSLFALFVLNFLCLLYCKKSCFSCNKQKTNGGSGLLMFNYSDKEIILRLVH